MKRAFLVLVAFGVAGPASSGQQPLRKEIIDLVALMEKDESKVVALVKLTDRDFGLRPDLWRKWLKRTSDKQLAKVAERIRRAEELHEEWRKVVLGSAGLSFSLTDQDKEARKKAVAELEELRKKSVEPQAWAGFSGGVGVLSGGGERADAAREFRAVVDEGPLSHYAAVSDELALLLERMAEEDKAWVEPQALGKLTLEQKIRYHVHHLRDVQARQWSQPGTCHVLDPFGMPREKDSKPNAAKELRKLGKEAIPALIGLLDDRRPIRSVGYWRNFWPEQTVLRYQDAAIQILDQLLPARFYLRSHTAAYLSNESPEIRYGVVHRLRNWHRACTGKSEREQLWLAVRTKPGIYPALQLLRALATEHDQRKEALRELHGMYRSLHRLYRPHIAELMADLGDESKVGEVLGMLDDRSFRSGTLVDFPDFHCPESNAEEAARRLLTRYGKAKRDAERK